MKSALSWLALFFLLIASLFVTMNIFSGLALVDRDVGQAEWHLLRGISIVVCSIFGNLILLKKWQTHKEQQALRSEIVHQVPGLSQMAIATLVVSIISLITGTISNPGSFPLLHGVLGFSLVALVLSTTLSWAYVIFRS